MIAQTFQPMTRTNAMEHTAGEQLGTSVPPAQQFSKITPAIDVNSLCDLALEGLAPMFDIEANLFCYRRKKTAAGMVNDGVSHRYTVITLLGLLEAEASGMRSPVAWQGVLERLLESLDWVGGVGDLGLLLWLCAAAGPKYLGQLCHSVDIPKAFHRFGDTRMGKTTELAWFLTGASYAAATGQGYREGFRAIARQAYVAIKNNQRPGGLFGHLAKRATVRSALRGKIGCFADQVYPIYALVRFAAIYKEQAALDMARNCAEAICRLQGPQGQWWWHYDSATSKVVGKYPVFSVHQDGMAPMALFAVSDEIDEKFTAAAYKGLQWIGGNNELGYEMRHYSSYLIWRSIDQEQKYRAYIAHVLGMESSEQTSETDLKLNLTLECRPYHLGWLLYAFAGRRNPSSQAAEPESAAHQ
jgi:hypothetical protein